MRERVAALLLLLLSLGYGLEALRIELYPGAELEALSPRGFPLLLAVAGVGLSFTLLFQRRDAGRPLEVGVEGSRQATPSERATVERGQAEPRQRWGRVLVLCALMVLYGSTLRTAGFVLATVLFLALSLWTLGERRRTVLLAVPVAVALFFYISLQWLLGIYLADPVVEGLRSVVFGADL